MQKFLFYFCDYTENYLESSRLNSINYKKKKFSENSCIVHTVYSHDSQLVVT